MDIKEELLQRIESGDAEKIRDFLFSLPDDQRQPLRAPLREKAKTLYKTFRDTEFGRIAFPSSKTSLLNNQVFCSTQALLTCGTLSEVKKIPWYAELPNDETVLIFEKIRPPWIQEWVDHEITKAPGSRAIVRQLYQAGLCQRPDHANYTLGIIQAPYSAKLGGLDYSERESPDVLKDEIWKLFEVDGISDCSLANYDQYLSGKVNQSWMDWFKKKSEEGILDRNQLLDASLSALQNDWVQYRSSWFSRFHEFMEPTPEERAQRQDTYTKLLGSSISPTVTFSLDALTAINKADQLDHNSLLNSISPVFLSPKKGPVLKGLKLITTSVKKNPDLCTKTVLVVAEGLLNESPEVQGKIADFLIKHGESDHPPLLQAIQNSYSYLAPSVRQLLEAKFSLSSLQKEQKREEDFGQTTEIPQDSLPHPSKDPLDDSFRISSIQNLDQLFESSAYVLENLDDIDAYEQIIAAIISFSNSPEVMTHPNRSPLFKRVKTVKEKQERDYFFYPPHRFYVAILEAWLEPSIREPLLKDLISARKKASGIWGKARDAATKYWFGTEEAGSDPWFFVWRNREARTAFLSHRFAEILEHICKTNKLPILSTPTHQHSFLHPETLLERILTWEKARTTPLPCDIHIALLRLHLTDDIKKSTLKKSKPLQSQAGLALRYALGADESPGSDLELFSAASRVRCLGKDDPEMIQAFPQAPPGAGHYPRYSFEHQIEKNTYHGETYTRYYLIPQLDPQPKQTLPPFSFCIQLSEALGDIKYSQKKKLLFFGGRDRPEWLWLNSLWPSDREPLYANGIIIQGNYMDSMEVAELPLFYLYELMGDDYEQFGPNALYLLNLGLSCPKGDGRIAAANAFVRGIERKVLNPQALAQSISKIFASGLINTGRIRKSLDSVIHLSKEIRQATKIYLTALLSGDPTQQPRDLGKLLELLAELLIEENKGITDERTRHYLENITGTGKAAKLAKKILKLN